MQLTFKAFFLGAIISIATISCTDEFFIDNPVDVIDETPVTINFWSNSSTLHENAANAFEIIIPFSGDAPKDGLVKIQIESGNAVFNQHYTTTPEATNGTITMPVTKGDNQLTFTMTAVDDAFLNGHKEIMFKIIGANGGVQKGASLGFMVYLLDDELVAKPKSFETIGGDQVKRTYEYDVKGRIAKVNWETRTPFLRTGTYTYFYNETDQVVRVNEDLYHDVYYTWTNGRITKSERNNNGTVTQYNEYHYDSYGNVSATAFYYRQSSGAYTLGLVIDYLYFLDGNIYKAIKSAPTGTNGAFQTLSTQTYDGYVEGNNPFPMVDILPNIKSQTKLPTYYRVEEHGFDFVYHISYQLSSDGRVMRRDVSGNAGAQVTHYEYY